MRVMARLRIVKRHIEQPRQTLAQPLGAGGKAAVAAALSAVAGFVDVVGWLALAHVYSANMTGNTIHLAQGVTQHHALETLARGWPILWFVFGLFASELVYELMRQRGTATTASVTLGAEALFILIVALLLPLPPDGELASAAGWRYFAPVGMLALAMGLQNATLVRVGASTIYTTNVTGNLTRLAREGAHFVIWLPRRRMGERMRSQRSLRRVLLMAGVWTAYFAGALLGVMGRGAWGMRALAVPVVGLLALVLVDALRPIAGHGLPDQPDPMF